MSMTRKNILRISLVFILSLLSVAFGLYVVLTGGVTPSVKDDFGGQRDIVLVDGLRSDVCLEPSGESLGIPCIFHYCKMGKPFDLRVQLWDMSKQYESIEITEVLVQYTDGEMIRRTTPWIRRLQPYTEYQSSSSGTSHTQIFMLSDQISNLVLRHTDVKITLTGQLTKADGQKVTFNASETFTAESRTWIHTFWEDIASC
jgi:hypothetical protein